MWERHSPPSIDWSGFRERPRRHLGCRRGRIEDRRGPAEEGRHGPGRGSDAHQAVDHDGDDNRWERHWSWQPWPLHARTPASTPIDSRSPISVSTASPGQTCPATTGASPGGSDRRGVTADNLVRNDTFAVLRAGTPETWGVAVVCGFGTNCSGSGAQRQDVPVPALGQISGDWGGASELGMAALWHALRASDGRGRRTAFVGRVPGHFGLRRPREVMEALYFDRLDPDRLAELAPIVFQAARDGDAVARSLVDRQADEIAIMAVAAIRRLGLSALPVPVVLGGGIFRTDDRAFFERIHSGIHAVAPHAVITLLIDPPVIGAAHLGLDRLGAARSSYHRVRAALTHERLSAHTHRRRKEPVHGPDRP